MISKAFTVLGIIKHLSKEFKLTKILKSCALIRSILEYGSVLWNPYTDSDSNQLEHIHRRFFRFGNFVPDIPNSTHN